MRLTSASCFVLLTGLGMLTACTDVPAEQRASEPAETTGAGAETLDPLSAVEEVNLVTGGGEVAAEVYPLVAVDDYLVLTVDLHATSVPEGAEWGVPTSRFEGDATLNGSSFLVEEAAALRLIEPGTQRIHLAATDDEAHAVGTASGMSGFYVPESGIRVQRVYAAPESDDATLGLLLPGTYIDELPVVHGDVPAPYAEGDEDGADQYEDYDITSAVGTIAEAPVLALEGYSRQLEGAVEVIESTEKVEIRLSGDVLFATGSHDLGEGGADAISAAVATIESYDSGVIDVVGHTDDVGDDASNQGLSERRATAVAEALTARVDTDAYDIEPSGKGETEPLVTNDSDENRQLNRRVTLTLTSEKTTETEIPTSGDLPPFEDGPQKDGAEAEAATGFDREVGDGYNYHVSAPAARRVDGMLVVTVEATRLDEGPAENLETSLGLGGAAWSFRGMDTGYSSENAGFAPRLLVGSTATYPLDYLLGESAIEGSVEWRNASDPTASDYAAGGTTLRFVALYRDIPDATTLTLEQPFVLGTTPWRLTDIPIEN
ncbi:hypothetical protein GCM10022202_18620 [Microbacterium marinilacus]|uniref:OmpA-like domain-containing protein n=2 Tax=Microbacterium marinilacus TaxID=415209 RepID=A0ABP7BEP1_9MICO